MKLEPTKKSLSLANELIKNKVISFHNHWHILYDVCDSIEKEEITYIEIGTFAGASGCLVASHPKTRKVYCVDMCDSWVLKNHFQEKIKEGVIENLNRYKNDKCDVEYFDGDSHDENIISLVKSKTDKVDILFIDAGHTYDDVIKDFNNFSDLVTDGGYIIFDDYNDSQYCPEVKTAVDDIVKTLNVEKYEIIGELEYDFLNETNIPHFKKSNNFILRKK